ncbi:uncharacterized protein JCM15063_000041 [Sporobolomyces koalae]|uniref:uncharacterized protein n=1 Tax=Sporobolomyces koalae TaxID=500713 RepID=UPI00316E5EDE
MHSGGTPTYQNWQNNTDPCWWRDRGLRVNTLYCVILFLGLATSGYDGSYLSGLQALATWRKYFGHPDSKTLGLLTASAYFPTLLAPIPLSWICDRYGRRPAILIGASFIVAGAIVGGLSQSLGMLIGGRIIVGFGNVFLLVSTLCLCNELTHPRLRSVTTAFVHTVYYVGSIIAALLTFGFGFKDNSSLGNWVWRVPALFQAFTPIILIICTLLFLPESPRYLISRGRNQEALELVARLHANGKLDDELVVNSIHEMTTAIALEQQSKGTTWRSMLATKGNRRRLLVITVIASATQWLGQGILSYYIAPVLKTVGLTTTRSVTGFNLGLSVWNWFCASLGASLVDRVGRRPLWIYGTFAFFVSYTCFMICSALYAERHDKHAANAAMFFIFTIYAAYNMSYNPLSYSYVVEILPFSLRSKGVAYFNVIQTLAVITNQYVNPIALAKIHWKYYGVYVAISFAYGIAAIFLYPETKGLTAEEVGALFDKGTETDNLAIITANRDDLVKRSKEEVEEIEKI